MKKQDVLTSYYNFVSPVNGGELFNKEDVIKCLEVYIEKIKNYPTDFESAGVAITISFIKEPDYSYFDDLDSKSKENKE